MTYEVSFKAKLEGVNKWVYVGPQWINHPASTATMIKEVCGSYPSEWHGKACDSLLPILDNACKLLMSCSQEYRQYETDKVWGTVESTLKFLTDIRNACEAFPSAVIEVVC